jgi:hypothetical protein
VAPRISRLQAGDKYLEYARRHLSTAMASGIAEAQSLLASASHAALCCGVPWAEAAPAAATQKKAEITIVFTMASSQMKGPK